MLRQTSVVLFPFSINSSSKNGFLMVVFTLAISFTYTLDQIGSIPCDTCPRMNADDVVGAIAFKVALRLPYPLSTAGSPNFSANSSDALYDLVLIPSKISLFKL